MDGVNRVVIEAKFSLILRWTTVLALTLVVFSFVLAWLGNSDSTDGQVSGDKMFLLATQILGWGVSGVVCFSVVLYGITRLSVVTVTPDLISGRNYWAFKVQFPPGSVTKVSATTYQGVRYLWLSSSESRRRLCLVLLGVPIAQYVGDLSRILGPEHELTKWFSSNA